MPSFRRALTFVLGLALPLSGCSGAEFSAGNPEDASADASVTDGGIDSDASLPDAGLPELVLEASVVGGISIVPPSGLITSEDGDQAAFEIVLVNAPDADVTIPLESDAPDEGMLSTDEVVFTRENWDVPQTVVVTGQDDDNVDGNQPYLVRTLPASSNDAQYDGVNATDVGLVNLDNDSVGIRFSPTTGLITTEAGGQANFTARLLSKPTGEVAVFLQSTNTREGTVSPRVLTFTPENWNSATMVTVTGVDDGDADGPVEYAVVVENVISEDGAYSSLDTEDIRVELQNTDDDSAGVTVMAEELFTSERGDTATFSVMLNREPNDEVLIRLSSSDQSEGMVAPSLLTFTPDNWNAPQEVTVVGVDDDETDGDQEYTVELDQALSVDPAYNGIDVPDVTVTNIDDDSAGFSVSPRQLTVAEDGTSGSFEIRLNTAPSASVVVSLSVTDDTEGTLDREQVTFTPDDWQDPQTVNVSGVDDEESDGNQPFTVLTAPAQSEDDTYRGLDPDNVQVMNLDDDTAGITVTPVMGLVTNETGATAEFSVELLTAPNSPVRLSLTSSDEGEGEVTPAQLEFDADNWEEPAIVTVSGVDDGVTDGAQPFAIITEIDSDDEAYASLLVPDVAATNNDDECPLPPIIDDMEDQNLAICPSQGRSGSWLSENAQAGEIVLNLRNAERMGSDFALFADGSPTLAGIPTGGDLISTYPILAVHFGGNNMMEPQPFNAENYTGFRFFAGSEPAGTLVVSVVTIDTAVMVGGSGAACRFGCDGHFMATTDLKAEWGMVDVPFESLQQGDDRTATFNRSAILGLKFALQADADYELFIDDITFY